MCNWSRKIFLIIRILLKRTCLCRGEIYWLTINTRWWKESFVNEFGFHLMWAGSVLKWNREKTIGDDLIKLKKIVIIYLWIKKLKIFIFITVENYAFSALQSKHTAFTCFRDYPFLLHVYFIFLLQVMQLSLLFVIHIVYVHKNLHLFYDAIRYIFWCTIVQ